MNSADAHRNLNNEVKLRLLDSHATEVLGGLFRVPFRLMSDLLQ